MGIRPRWQLFLTTRALPELEAFVALSESLSLEERVRALGYEFQVFVHQPAPDGEAMHIEPLRPPVEALARIPGYLAEKTMQHHGKTSLEECLGRAEDDWLPELLCCDQPRAEYPEIQAFMVTPDLDVYWNGGELAPWWRLGNLEAEDIERVM